MTHSTTEALSAVLAQLDPTGEPKLTLVSRSEAAETGAKANGEWRVAVFSSSFNPFTIAHAYMCSEAQKFVHDHSLSC